MKPKARKVLITYDEYLAIKSGLGEIEATIGSGYLSDEDVKIYEKYSKDLEKLLKKIIRV